MAVATRVEKIIDAGDMSASITSSTFDCSSTDAVSIQLHAASATHVGTVAVQGSIDGTNWNAITLDSTPTAASGSAFDALIELAVAFKYLRVVYTFGSGAGSLDCWACLKG